MAEVCLCTFLLVQEEERKKDGGRNKGKWTEEGLKILGGRKERQEKRRQCKERQ